MSPGDRGNVPPPERHGRKSLVLGWPSWARRHWNARERNQIGRWENEGGSLNAARKKDQPLRVRKFRS